MKVIIFRYPKQTFGYEYTIKDESCCHDMQIRWNTNTELINTLKDYITTGLIKFCPFCGKEIIIEID